LKLSWQALTLFHNGDKIRSTPNSPTLRFMKDSKILRKDMLNKSTKRLSNSTNKPMLREKQMRREEPETTLPFLNCKLVIKKSKTQFMVCGIDSTKCKKLNKD